MLEHLTRYYCYYCSHHLLHSEHVNADDDDVDDGWREMRDLLDDFVVLNFAEYKAKGFAVE
jgi:hypothetical protein